MISEKEVFEIHSILIERFGGANGVRDKELLDSALNRPYQTFDGNELYPTPIDKAAAILESIVKNHPFTDGNKRTGYVLARLLLMNEHLDIVAEQEEKYEFVISISTGELSYDQIKDWLHKRTQGNRVDGREP
ncbi:MAG: Fic family protein [Balneolaceae bacterium]